MSRVVATAASLLVVGGLWAGALASAPVAVADPAPVRIMLVGDSITEGSSGDWTWRYRLATYLDASGVTYQFVGPRTAMLDLADNLHDSYEYAEPDFDQHHFARWGESLHAILDENAGTPEDGIGWAVSTFQPDVVIEVLGTNDLLYGSSPQETVEVAHQFVAEVRNADPDSALVLSTAPDIGYAHFPEYNALLEATAPDWSTPTSPVVVSTPDEDWNGVVDTCDSTHPSAVGEVKIAAAQADALAALGIGSPTPRPLAEPPVGPRQPATLTGTAGDGQVALSWHLPPGGTAVLISTRDATAGEAWHQLPFAVGGTAWLSNGLVNGHTYEYRLNVLKHDCLAADVVSDVVAATPAPAVPGDVTGLTAAASDHGLDVAWDPVPGATSSQVWFRPSDQPDAWQTRSATGTSYSLDGLLAGASYDVAVQGVGPGGVGPRSTPVSVTASGVVPSAPVVTRVAARADGSALVRWTVPPAATQFVFAHRSAHRGSRWVAGSVPVADPSVVVAGLRSGQSYLFRVTAMDDRLRGGTSAPVRAVVPRVAPVVDVHVRRSSATRARTRGDPVPFAHTYVLLGASSSGCAHVPSASRFRIEARGLELPRATVRLPRATLHSAAFWVRWFGMRDGVRGRTSALSVACLRLPR